MGRKDHLVSWKVVYRSRKNGGLGVGNLVERNVPLA